MVFRKKKAIEEETMDNDVSIYDHLLAHMDQATGRLTPEGRLLPDETQRFEDGAVSPAAGAWDGIISHHIGKREKSGQVTRMIAHLKKIAQKGSKKDATRLYDLLIKDNLMLVLDQIHEEIPKAIEKPTAALHDFALALACGSPDRGPVKFGIFLLGMIGLAEDLEIVYEMGKHDEFTLFSSVALYYLSEDPEKDLWQLARLVTGWGRVHIVERLAYSDDQNIKEWIVRDGFRNSIMNEYLAFIAARTGELHRRLAEEGADPVLLTAAAEIITALVAGGPAEGMDDYQEARPCVEGFLDRLESPETALQAEHFFALAAIKKYLTAKSWNPDARRVNGWNDHNRARTIDRTEDLLARPGWKDLAEKRLVAPDDNSFQKGYQLATALEMDTWPVLWQRLKEKPLMSQRWVQIVEGRDRDQMASLAAMAEDVLPLEAIASGPADRLGLGPDYEPHRCLAALVSRLGTFPGLGWPLIQATLQSPVTEDRRLALRVLAAWGRNNWPEAVGPSLQKALSREPRKDVMQDLVRVIKGESPAPQNLS